MMSKLIEERLGQEVQVYYLVDSGPAANSDRGLLVEQDGVFLRLQRPKSSDLLVPLSAIRIIAVEAEPAKGTRNLPRTVASATEALDEEVV